VSEEEQGETDSEGGPEGELLGERKGDNTVEPHETRHHDNGGGSVINIDGADKISLFALEFELTREALSVHREDASEQRRKAAPGAL
jgi:hypothetical protein